MEALVTLPVVVMWEKDRDEILINDVIVDGSSIIKDLKPSDLEFIMSEIQHEQLGEIQKKGETKFDLENVEVEVDYKYYSGTMDSFSKAHGNWLPGDPDELDILSVKVGDVDVMKSVSEKDMEKIEKEIDSLESMSEAKNFGEALNAAKRYHDSINRVEKKLYSRMRRGKIKSTLGKKGKSKIPGFGYWFNRN